jgi:hypothetical protein
MASQQQHPDGSWGPAQPLGYQPGYDVEHYGDHWELFRTTRTDSVEVARGHSRIGLLFAYWWRRLLRPVR